jgi:hypothetical protein
MKWTSPQHELITLIEEDVELPKFPLLIVLMITLVIFAVFAGYNIINWPENKNVDHDFWFYAIICPIVWSSIVWGGAIFGFRVIYFSFNYSKNMAEFGAYNFKRWAISAVPLQAYSLITPVEDLTLKIMGLEGEAPVGPATPLKIDTGEISLSETRLRKLLMSLLSPLSDYLTRHDQMFDTWIYVKNSDESVQD